MIKITFPSGEIREYESGILGIEIAKSINHKLAKSALGIKINDKVSDLMKPIKEDAKVNILTWEDEDGKGTFWHSSAHLMAAAIQKLYPKAKFGIGPSIENGFYYDIDFGEQEINDKDLSAIENEMKKLAKNKEIIERKEIAKNDALKFFQEDQYKVELIKDLQDGTISFYQLGEFTDLCRGPHIPNTSYIKAIKLMNIAGAYWRGNEKNKQLTRIYGITFPKQKMLEEYLMLLEEAKKRDHKKLGKELELFIISEKVGSGLPIWLPNGMIIREKLISYLKEEQRKLGYKQIYAPHIGKKDLYLTSGHYAKYGEDSFQPIKTPHEGEEYLLKPMNCPHHCEVYASSLHSYKELPIKLSEFGTVYRYEQSGELNGLVRARSFTQDDAHIFCRPDQLKTEFLEVVDIIMKMFRKLGFDEFKAQVSLRDSQNKDKYIGSDLVWEKSENAIIEAAREKGLETTMKEGEAAFYGPKLDFFVKDALGREWQLGTVQVDYNLPERFKLEYIGQDGMKHRPIMIHRAPFGSLERFIGLLIEHSGGNFPLWLAPIQVSVLPISDKYIKYAKKICSYLENNEIRASLDNRNEKIGKKVRDAELSKIPYMVIVGEKEEKEEKISVRKRKEGDIGGFSLSIFLENLNKEINN